MHRIRNAMGNPDARYTLEGLVEFDEAYFEKATPEGLVFKRVKGSQRQQNVEVMAESTPLEHLETGTQNKYCRYFKMKVLNRHTSAQINYTVSKNIDDISIVCSDKSKSYLDIANYVEAHLMYKSDKHTTESVLKRGHIAISNAKRTLLGIYHKTKGKYLQLYLDEFCYKLNLRYFGNQLFERLTLAVAKSYW